jgi:Tfp pilus assembly protein PilN
MSDRLSSLRTVLQRLLRVNRFFAGIELYPAAEGEWLAHVVVLEARRRDIRLRSAQAGLTSLEAVRDAIARPGVASFLVVNHKGLLHRVDAADANVDKLLAALLPDASLEEFVVQQEALDGGKVVSVARRESVEQLLEAFRGQGLSVVSLGLGPFAARLLAPFVGANDELVTETHKLLFRDGTLAGFERRAGAEPVELALGADRLDSRFSVAYGGALHVLLGGESPVELAALAAARHEVFQQNLYLRLRWPALAALLLVLLVNTFFYTRYKDENQRLELELKGSARALARVDSLRRQVAEQQELIRKTNLQQASRTSFYADRLATSLPPDVTLLELRIFPVDGREDDYGRDELLVYQGDRIIVRGKCRSSTAYNQWLAYLARQPWVVDVRHRNYSDVSLSQGVFEFQITVPSAGTPASSPDTVRE